MAGWHLGIIGGSGLYEPGELEDAQEIDVRSPFGEPSGPVTTGFLSGVRCTFLARHGAGHRLPPSAVNYRANVDVLKRCGVTDLVAVSAVGSLREDMAPGDFVVVDQFIDRTIGRERSFFGPGFVAHVGLGDPVCPRLSGLLADAAGAMDARLHRSGCYVAIEGPQFSTRAESVMYRGWGADVIGMTAMPEVRLAREAELPYALLGMVTDYDCWREGEPEVDVSGVLEVMRTNAVKARRTLAALAASLPAERPESPIDRALDHAIITPRNAWDRHLVARLDAVAGRILPKAPNG
ncbi:5'-methylthioadenosine phosphorylase [Altererythrobacter atlanticus]|uniref:S-methyl-5'-thioadenosine phosphorylase n=1 Tax=Croceibacterium atlanticum TaxID=1267766 RepID=A0A0F7KPM2_9SPHN|nr:S-methyl-5'-thioadenosine phosphorylase [Croceibacterium atlanticum]AKH42453.1 S-methyl-5'-thioadenosine phosphorylase [Croceibacterium atlanticum]MBB5731230.1 5'-methylthioadenosine phosphorylase [Croceibacterium atlanticum]